MEAPRYEVHPAGLFRQRYSFRFIARNGEITSVSSETYRDSTDAVRGARDDLRAHQSDGVNVPVHVVSA